MYKIFKRFIDIVCSIVLLPAFLLIYLFIAIAIKKEDGGPVFYKASRIGKNCTRIEMLKFRSMSVNSTNIHNADGSTYNAKNDPRVTKVGKFLRETSIDEIPQIINVLKGEMSLIGPRASEWAALSTYKSDELDKMNVQPGITGYTQAYYRNSISVREKRLLDVWYAHNVSIKLDISIFFKTIVTVLKHNNLYTNTTKTQSEIKSELEEATATNENS